MPLASKSASRRSTSTPTDLPDSIPSTEIVAGGNMGEKKISDDLFTNDIMALGSITHKLLKGSLYTPQILNEPRSRRRVSLSPERSLFPTPPSTTKRSNSPTKKNKKIEKTKNNEKEKSLKVKKSPQPTQLIPPPTTKTVTFLEDSPKSQKLSKKPNSVPEDDLFFMGSSSISKKTSVSQPRSLAPPPPPTPTSLSKPSPVQKHQTNDPFMEYSTLPSSIAKIAPIASTNSSNTNYTSKPRSALESMPYVPPTSVYSMSSQQAPVPQQSLNSDLSLLASQRRLEEKLQQHHQNHSNNYQEVNNRDSFGNNQSSFNMMSQTSSQHSKLHAQMLDAFQRISLLTNGSEDKNLSSYKEASERKLLKAEEIIEALRKENESLKKEIKEVISNAIPTPTSNTKIAFNPIPESIINLYESMCGLKIVSESTNVWHCSVEGKHGHFTFDLSLVSSENSASNDEGPTYIYTPTFGPSTPIAKRLPSYLQCEISFMEDQLQLFFWRALNFLMSHQS